ncbi:MAG TPA: hypothetical protein VKI61_06350 [Chitinophagaceae bacterium]|jgi:hypothetical protein|nr:hypothetical protein [Chitinophagaceae bacterium]
MRSASAEVGLMFTIYNLGRLLNIIGKNVLKKFFKELAPLFKREKALLKTIIIKMRHFIFKEYSRPIFFYASLMAPDFGYF